MGSLTALDSLLDSLVHDAIILTGARGGCSGLLTPDGMVCKKYLKGSKWRPLKYCWPPGEGLPGWVLVNKAAYVANAVAEDPAVAHELYARLGVHSALCAPIIDGHGDLLGFLEVHNKRSKSGFTSLDQEKLVATLEAAAIAIQDALAEREAIRAELDQRTWQSPQELQDDAARDGILIIDGGGKIVSLNHCFIRMWGIPDSAIASRLSARDILEFIRDKLSSPYRFIEGMVYLMTHPDAEDHGEIVLKDGRIFGHYSAPIRDTDGMNRGRVWRFRDVTSGKRAEERLRLLAEAGDILATSLDYEATLKNVARLIVPTFADLCGIFIKSSEEDLLRPVEMAHADPVKEESLWQMRALQPLRLNSSHPVVSVVNTREPVFYPEFTESIMRAIATDPQHLKNMQALNFKSYMSVPLLARGEAIGAISFAITESERRYTAEDLDLAQRLAQRATMALDNARLYAESQRVQAELRRAIEAKDDFLGMVSHELRTPLTIILSSAHSLAARGSQLDEEIRASYLSGMLEESERLYRMVEDLLVLARVEPASEIALEPVPVQRTIERMAVAHQQRSPGRKIKVHIEDDLEPVAAQPGFVEHVMRNLLSNAEAYSPPDSPIEILARRNGDEVMISVCDRGVGVSAEEAELIFERFYRSDRIAMRARGMGIGLTVCKRLVEAQSGCIWASPREGGGLEVSFTLPVCRELVDGD